MNEQDFLRKILRSYTDAGTYVEDENVKKLIAWRDAHTATVAAEAEHRGRHAEVVKALFLIESLSPDYNIVPWLKERLATLNNTQSEKGK